MEIKLEMHIDPQRQFNQFAVARVLLQREFYIYANHLNVNKPSMWQSEAIIASFFQNLSTEHLVVTYLSLYHWKVREQGRTVCGLLVTGYRALRINYNHR